MGRRKITKNPKYEPSLEDALIVMGACGEAVDWVREQRCSSASEVLARLADDRLADPHWGGRRRNWQEWLSHRIKCPVATAPLHRVREAMIKHTIHSIQCVMRTDTSSWEILGSSFALRRHKKKVAAAKRLMRALRTYGYCIEEQHHGKSE